MEHIYRKYSLESNLYLFCVRNRFISQGILKINLGFNSYKAEQGPIQGQQAPTGFSNATGFGNAEQEKGRPFFTCELAVRVLSRVLEPGLIELSQGKNR